MASVVRYEKQGCTRLPRMPVPVEAEPRRERLSPEQLTWRRYEDWRIAHDVGLPNERGVLVRRSASMIAALYDVSLRTVRHGIRSAREVRLALQDGAVA